MKILIIIMLIFTFKSSLSFSEEVKMMECRVVKTMQTCNPKNNYDCVSRTDNESYKNSNYNLVKYVKNSDGDEIYYRDEGKWKLFEVDKIKTDQKIISSTRKVSNYTGYYKIAVGTQSAEYWFDFFYPSRKTSHSIFINSKINKSSMIYNFKCRKFKN